MNEHNQIAAEAAAKCLIQFYEICDVKVPVSQLPKCKNALEQAGSIIKSVIEKVERDAFQRGWNDREARSKAAPNALANERDARVRYISESHPALNPSGAHASEPFPKNREEMNATHKAQHDAIDDAMGKEISK